MSNGNDNTIAFFRRNLPHWLMADRAYFVTLRLHGTLPHKVVEELRAERKRLDARGAHEKKHTDLQREQFRRIESILDTLKWPHEGLCEWRIGHMLMENLTWLRKRGWTLYAAVLMNTHAHVLMRSTTGNSGNLVADVDAFKSFTGSEANRLSGSTGRYWARDSFDHWVRNADSFEAFVRYIVNNPVRAGLVNAWHNWRWTVLDDSVRYIMK